MAISANSWRATVKICLLLCVLSLVGGCQKRLVQFNTQKTQNRLVAFYAVGPQQNPGKLAEPTHSEALQAIEAVWRELYDCRTQFLQGEPTLSQELPIAALQSAALAGADDLLLLVFPAPQTIADATTPQDSTLSLRLFNLGNLRQTLALQVLLHESLATTLRSQLAGQLPDPNVHPAGDRGAVALHLEQSGKLREALVVYERQLQELSSTLHIHQIDQRDRLEHKVNELRDLLAREDLDAQERLAVYSFNVVFENIGRGTQEILLRLIESLQLNSYFARYTDKPVELRLAASSDLKQLHLSLRLRYQRERYLPELQGKPIYQDRLRILHLSPYFHAMYKLQELHLALTHELSKQAAPLAEKQQIEFVLTKVNNDEVGLPVVASAKGKLLMPYELQLRIRGFEPLTAVAASKVVFDRYGYFTLGPAKLLSGQQTQWGLLADFFALPEP